MSSSGLKCVLLHTRSVSQQKEENVQEKRKKEVLIFVFGAQQYPVNLVKRRFMMEERELGIDSERIKIEKKKGSSAKRQVCFPFSHTKRKEKEKKKKEQDTRRFSVLITTDPDV